MLNIYRDANGSVKYRMMPRTMATLPSKDPVNVLPLPKVLKPGMMRFDKWVDEHEDILYASTRYIEDRLSESMMHDSRFYMPLNAIAEAFTEFAYRTSSSAAK
jgi:hypothetical protein